MELVALVETALLAVVELSGQVVVFIVVTESVVVQLVETASLAEVELD